MACSATGRIALVLPPRALRRPCEFSGQLGSEGTDGRLVDRGGGPFVLIGPGPASLQDAREGGGKAATAGGGGATDLSGGRPCPVGERGRRALYPQTVTPSHCRSPAIGSLVCVSRRLALCGILARRADADEKGELASALTPARRGQAAHSSSVPSTTTTASPPTPSITVSIRHANHRLVVERLGPSTTVSPLPSGGVCAKTSSSVWGKAARCSHPQAGSGVRRSRSP